MFEIPVLSVCGGRSRRRDRTRLSCNDLYRPAQASFPRTICCHSIIMRFRHRFCTLPLHCRQVLFLKSIRITCFLSHLLRQRAVMPSDVFKCICKRQKQSGLFMIGCLFRRGYQVDMIHIDRICSRVQAPFPPQQFQCHNSAYNARHRLLHVRASLPPEWYKLQKSIQAPYRSVKPLGTFFG